MVYVATRLLGHDDERLQLFHELRQSDDGSVLASGEHLLLHVAGATGRVGPALPQVLEAMPCPAWRHHPTARQHEQRASRGAMSFSGRRREARRSNLPSP